MDVDQIWINLVPVLQQEGQGSFAKDASSVEFENLLARALPDGETSMAITPLCLIFV